MPFFLSVFFTPTPKQSSRGSKPTWRHLQHGRTIWRSSSQALPAREGALPTPTACAALRSPFVSVFMGVSWLPGLVCALSPDFTDLFDWEELSPRQMRISVHSGQLGFPRDSDCSQHVGSGLSREFCPGQTARGDRR